jgi:hypothetical protein
MSKVFFQEVVRGVPPCAVIHLMSSSPQLACVYGAVCACLSPMLVGLVVMAWCWPSCVAAVYVACVCCGPCMLAMRAVCSMVCVVYRNSTFYGYLWLRIKRRELNLILGHSQ